MGSFYVGNNMEWPHLMEQSMRAHVVYERDKDYVVERGPTGKMEVVIVDEYTGRKMAGRQWSDGLAPGRRSQGEGADQGGNADAGDDHAAEFLQDVQDPLSGMTGTAQTEAEEFSKIYKLDVVTIPTNRPVVRADQRRPRLSHRARKMGCDHRGDQGDLRQGPAGSGRHHQRGKERNAFEHAEAEIWHRP